MWDKKSPIKLFDIFDICLFLKFYRVKFEKYLFSVFLQSKKYWFYFIFCNKPKFKNITYLIQSLKDFAESYTFYKVKCLTLFFTINILQIIKHDKNIYLSFHLVKTKYFISWKGGLKYSILQNPFWSKIKIAAGHFE